MKHRLLYSSLAVIFSLAAAMPVFAQDTADNAQVSDKDVQSMMKAMQDQAARLVAQEKKLADQEKEMEAQKKTLAQQRLQFEKLQTQMIALTGKTVPIAARKSDPKPAETADAGKKSTASAPGEVGTERKEAKEKPPEVAAVIDQGGVLTSAGKIVVTPALEYSRSSATSVEITGFSVVPALNIGLFDIAQVNRDMISPSLGLRYGVTNRFEVEAKIPYVYRKDSTLAREIGGVNPPETLTSVSGADIGDLELSAHYQINNGHAGWPYLIGNLRFKTATGTSPFEVPIVGGRQQELPTGSGFYAVQPSLTAIYPSDPVVYYANLGYLHSFARSFPGFGNVEPGDGISASMGMSLSLNDKSSFSMGYSHTMVLKTMANNVPITNSDVLQVGSLDLGYSYNISDRTNINFTVSTGVTADAPDIRLIFRVPMTFDLF